MRVIATGLDTWIGFAALSPDGRWLAVGPGRATSRILIWDLFDPTAPPMHIPAEPNDRPDFPRTIAFSPDGLFLARGGTIDSRDGVTLWSVPGVGDVRRVFPGRAVTEFAFTPDGREMVGLEAGVPMHRWDFATGSLLPLPLEGLQEDPMRMSLVGPGMAISPDSRRFALPIFVLEGEQLRTEINLWEYPGGVRTAHVLMEASATPHIFNLTFSPDGATLAGRMIDEVIVWDAATLAVKARIRPAIARQPAAGDVGSICAPAFSPDGQFLAIGCYDGTVRFYDTTQWAEQRVFDWVPVLGHPEIYRPEDGPAVKAVLFTSDGTRAVAAYWYHFLVWDLDV